MRKRPTKKTTTLRSSTHDKLPASVGLVKEVREELRAEIRSVRHEITSVRSNVEAVRSEVGAVRHELDAIRGDVGSVRQEIQSVRLEVQSVRHELHAEIEKVAVAVHRTQVLMEEQRSENRIVLDGLKTVLDRQDRIENRLGL